MARSSEPGLTGAAVFLEFIGLWKLERFEFAVAAACFLVTLFIGSPDRHRADQHHEEQQLTRLGVWLRQLNAAIMGSAAWPHGCAQLEKGTSWRNSSTGR